MAAPERKIRVLCVDDHPLLRAGLAAVLQDEPDIQVVAEASNGVEAVARFRDSRPDVTLMDLRMPEMDGVEATRHIRAEFPQARIIVLTSYVGDEDVRRALDVGAQGYLIKDMLRTEVVAAVRAAHSGRKPISSAAAAQLADNLAWVPLTVREREVLRGLSRGQRNKEIAYDLGITEATVKVHVNNILSKLNASDRTQAVTTALKRGLLQLE